jgi:hypothetical protein
MLALNEIFFHLSGLIFVKPRVHLVTCLFKKKEYDHRTAPGFTEDTCPEHYASQACFTRQYRESR